MLAALLATLALAQAFPPRLFVERAPDALSCPAAEELDALVSARMGVAAFATDGARRVRVDIRRDGPDVRAVVEMFEADGTPIGRRELQARETGCSQLRDALVITLAVALDQLGRLPPAVTPTPAPAPTPVIPDDAPPREAMTVAPPRAPPPAPPRPARSTRPRPPSPRYAPNKVSARSWWGIEVAGAGLASLGQLPAMAPGASVGVALRVSIFRLGMEATSLAPAIRVAGSRPWVAGSGLVTISGCVTAGWLGGCALVGGGGSAQALIERAFKAPVLTPALMAGGRWYVDLPVTSRWALRLNVDVTSPLAWTRVLLDGVTAWRSSPLVVTAGSGLRVVW